MSTEHGFTLELDVKALAEDGTFTGYASTFNNVDLGRDIVMPGAFQKSLAVRPASRVKLLRNHDASEPVGVVLSLEEDAKGLKIKGQVTGETARGRETLSLMRTGALDAMSIGYRTIKDTFDRVKGARLLQQLDLYECSICTFPMNPRATVSAVKSDEALERARALVRAIQRVTEALKQ